MKAEFVIRDEHSESVHPAIKLTPENNLEMELLERFAILSGQMDRYVVALPEGGGSYELGILFDKSGKGNEVNKVGLGYDEITYKRIYKEVWEKFDEFGKERTYKDSLRLAVARIALMETKIEEITKIMKDLT